MKTTSYCWALSLSVFLWGVFGFTPPEKNLDSELQRALSEHKFTGRIQEQLEVRLGRKIDARLADLGRMLWFDTVGGLNRDNTCGGCHAPSAGFGDTQSISIGIDNNGVVGAGRRGPRNQRRAPMVLNAAFFPKLMWNSRFSSTSGDPFDNSEGYVFPLPEGESLSANPHLLTAQAFIPITERVEVAGFDFVGDNHQIRAEVCRRISAVPGYRKLFGQIYPSVKEGGSISIEMFAAAIAEFEFTLTFADAPIDRFARGQRGAMTDAMKRGALLFFGRAKCVSCHAVSGQSNEMFSDFKTHVAAIPQVMPSNTNMVFDGADANEDFGLEQVSGEPSDRYKFRTSPLRNVALQPTFFHNGAFVRLEEAIRYHLNTRSAAYTYSPTSLATDLQGPLGPIQPALDRLDAGLSEASELSEGEFQDLLAFVKLGLLDHRAKPQYLSTLIPHTVPSGNLPLVFEDLKHK